MLNEGTVREANHCLKLFSDSQKAFMRSERRTTLRSLLFDIPRRSSVGWHCFYEKGPRFLQQLSTKLPPEDAGHRMKRLCSRPYYLTLSILMCSYLGSRQQRLLDQGLAPGQPFPQEKFEEVIFLVDFWRRACQAYREDEALLPDQANYTQPILPADTVADLERALTSMNLENRKRLRRLAATLQLYCFILHGEQRDGIFAHGPYPLSEGSSLVVEEFTDLQNDFLPWAQTTARNPYPHLAIGLKLRGVRTRFDLFGGVLFDPPDITPQIEAAGLFTCEATGAIKSVSLREMEDIQQCAAEAQNEMYRKAAEWSPRFRIEYGVDLFANHLRSFFQLLETNEDLDRRIRAEFHAAAAGQMESLLASPEPPSIWKFMATTEGDYFWPVVTG